MDSYYHGILAATVLLQCNDNDKDKIIEVKIIMTGRKMREKARYAEEAKVCQVL